MLQNINRQKGSLGFTLVELLVGAGIFAIISVIGVQLLWDTLSTRAKQYSIETSTGNIRPVVSLITKSVREAKNVSVENASTIKITGEICRTIKLDFENKRIVQAVDSSSTCTPPEEGFLPITQDGIAIEVFDLSPVGDLLPVVTVRIEGKYKDSLGEHDINFRTTVSPRVTI